MTTAQNSINALVALEKIKVWSLIVSLFGDLDKLGAQSLSGKQLNGILGHIGIKPEATRVALHRLKNEEWIETSRSGRETIYKMSEKATSQTAVVYDEVYRTSIKYSEGWQLLLSGDNNDTVKGVKIPIFKQVSLAPIAVVNSSSDDLKIQLTPSNIPTWLGDKIVNAETKKIAVHLSKIVSEIKQSMAEFSELDQAAIRLLILHRWRKLALRDNVWCHVWLFKKGDLARCQGIVPHFLSELPGINASSLDDFNVK